MRSLSPIAAERIQAAVKSMEITLESGNKEAFVQAESASDMAGRLLSRPITQRGNPRKKRRAAAEEGA